MNARTFNTDQNFTAGIRVTLEPGGKVVAAPAGNNGIGMTAGNSTGGRVIVKLFGTAVQAAVMPGCPAGAALFGRSDGLHSHVAETPHQSPSAVALEPTGKVLAPIFILPTNQSVLSTSPSQSFSDDDDDGEDSSRHSTQPAVAGPALHTMSKIYADPVREVMRRKFDLVAAGMDPLVAMETVFTAKPNLAAQYQQAVRSDPAAIARAMNAEAQERIAAMQAKGMSRVNAMAAVFKADPSLQEAIVKNGQSAPTAASPGKPACEIEIERLVSDLKSRGMGHAQAVFQVYRQRPDLHQAYIAAYNQRRA